MYIFVSQSLCECLVFLLRVVFILGKIVWLFLYWF